MIASCDPDKVFLHTQCSVFILFYLISLVLVTLYVNQTTNEGSKSAVLPYRNAISAINARGMRISSFSYASTIKRRITFVVT